MGKIGIFYGSTTGNTESAAEKLREAIGEDVVDLYDVESATIENVAAYDNLVFGIPTWNIGELQEDWEDFIEHIEKDKITLKGKKIAFFGASDQEGYPDTFGDALGIVYDLVLEKKAVPVANKWPTDSYTFEDSKALRDGHFIGMLTDDDNQSELTDERVAKFAEMLKEGFGIA